MSYKLTKADGKSVIVQDYQKEIVGGLTMLGYGFTNYGDEMAQNFIKNLENNAGTAEPVNPVLGQFWFQLPNDVATMNKNVRVCTSTSAATLDGRWKVLFLITPAGDVLLDAWTLRGKGPAAIDGTSIDPGMPVVLNNSGKVPSQYLPAQTVQGEVEVAVRLRDTRTFGSRNGGLPFNGTQNVPLTTAHVGEGDQLYFTNQRAVSAMRPGRYIAIDSDGTIRFTGPDPTSGSTGSQGPAGPQGPKGDKGDKGDTGATGATGATGSWDGTSGFPSSLGVNGWQKLPNGFMMQWGQFTWESNMHGETFSFPAAFPNQCFNVYLSIKGNPNGSGDRNEEDDEQIWANPRSTTQFDVADTGDDHTTYGVAWFALGY